MKISQRLAFSLLMCAGVMFAAPFATAQEGMRPVGQLTYTPEPMEMQTGVFQLRPEDRDDPRHADRGAGRDGGHPERAADLPQRRVRSATASASGCAPAE